MTPHYILRKSLCRPAFCCDNEKMRRAETEIECMAWYHAYAEPGYRGPVRGILAANWNVFPAKASDLLERYGYACEWSDEWTACIECDRAVRTSPDCYGWLPAYIDTEDGAMCQDCARQDPETLIDWGLCK